MFELIVKGEFLMDDILDLFNANLHYFRGQKMTNFPEFREVVLSDTEAKKYYDKIEAFKMKTYYFTIKDGDGDLFSFELESDKTLEEVVKTSEFIDKLEENNFFYEDANYENLGSLEWTCFSSQEGAKGLTKEKTFDIEFSSEKIWKVG